MLREYDTEYVYICISISISLSICLSIWIWIQIAGEPYIYIGLTRIIIVPLHRYGVNCTTGAPKVAFPNIGVNTHTHTHTCNPAFFD